MDANKGARLLIAIAAICKYGLKTKLSVIPNRYVPSSCFHFKELSSSQHSLVARYVHCLPHVVFCRVISIQSCDMEILKWCNSLSATVQNLEQCHTDDGNATEQNQDLVTVFVFRCVVCWEEHHCKMLGTSPQVQSPRPDKLTWHPQDPRIGDNIGARDLKLSQSRVA